MANHPIHPLLNHTLCIQQGVWWVQILKRYIVFIFYLITVQKWQLKLIIFIPIHHFWYHLHGSEGGHLTPMTLLRIYPWWWLILTRFGNWKPFQITHLPFREIPIQIIVYVIFLYCVDCTESHQIYSITRVVLLLTLS